MNLPLQVTFRNMDTSPKLEEAVRAKLAALENHYDRIVSCRVTIEAPHKHHRSGNNFHVRIDLAVPGKELVVGRDGHNAGTHEDPYAALRDAFRALKRELHSFVDQRRERSRAQ